MSKKFLTAAVAGLSIVAFSVFSFGNALALDDGSEAASEPLTSPITLCNAAKASYKQEVAATRAKGMSLQLTREEIQQSIQEIKDYRDAICDQADALTSAVKLCKEAKKNYNRDVKQARATALSLHLSRGTLKQQLRNIKDYRDLVCKEAKTERRS
ncbi:MAG: hypothetical protein AAB588_02000 [Patescibacteria group bacterium]